jgi:hypothetical protein
LDIWTAGSSPPHPLLEGTFWPASDVLPGLPPHPLLGGGFSGLGLHIFPPHPLLGDFLTYFIHIFPTTLDISSIFWTFFFPSIVFPPFSAHPEVPPHPLLGGGSLGPSGRIYLSGSPSLHLSLGGHWRFPCIFWTFLPRRGYSHYLHFIHTLFSYICSTLRMLFIHWGVGKDAQGLIFFVY